jgi:glutamine amidotransferase
VTALTLIDSPVANVANIARALRAAGAGVVPTGDAAAVAASRKVVLPGVGSFRAAMEWLQDTGLDRALASAADRGAHILGVCVGHQLLFEASEEMGTTKGLGIVRGVVRKIAPALPVPQIGWNRVRCTDSPLFAGIPAGSPFYFVHSYAASGAPDEIASADYGAPFTAAVQRGNVFGVQFHPEKSSSAGLRVLANFVNL